MKTEGASGNRGMRAGLKFTLLHMLNKVNEIVISDT